LLPLKPMQCVVTAPGTVLSTSSQEVGQKLLLSRLYFRIAPGTVDGFNLVSLPSDNVSLWLEDVTFQGNFVSGRIRDYGRGIGRDYSLDGTTNIHAAGTGLSFVDRA
jgi:hypothetical protein